MNRAKCDKWSDLLLKKGFQYNKTQAILDRLLRKWNSEEKQTHLAMNFLTRILAHPSHESEPSGQYLDAQTSALILALQRDLFAFVSKNSSTWMPGYHKMSSTYWTLARDPPSAGDVSSLSFQMDPFSLNKWDSQKTRDLPIR